MKQRISDYIASFLVKRGITDIFTVVGGGAMYLNDSFGHDPDLHCTYNHHEQASAMAAEAYFKASGKVAAVCVTSGPGGINAMNGVAGAYMDSIPMIVISGQMKREMTTHYTHVPVRSLGTQEFDIVPAVQGMTKYAVMIERPEDIRYHLEKAYTLAVNGRPGPCWLDIPLDVQGAVIDTDELRGYAGFNSIVSPYSPVQMAIDEIWLHLKNARRPVFYAGNGIRIGKAVSEFHEFIRKTGMPVVTCWDSIDLIPTDDDDYCGRGGTMGDRAGNFAVQNSDFLLCVGNRLGILQAGYDVNTWARGAYTVMVDIDENELDKPTIRIDLPICADAGETLEALNAKIPEDYHVPEEWRKKCQNWKADYPVVRPEQYQENGEANVYVFIDTLSRHLPEDAVTVAANGSASVVGSQTFYIKKNSRFIMNCAISSMGYDLPAAIGAAVATGKNIYCIAGDGSIMMNLQELQTIITNKLPVKIFIINNQGYHQIRQTQINMFHDGFVGIGPDSGDLGFPDFSKVADAFGYQYLSIRNNSEMSEQIDEFLNKDGAGICEVFVSTTQKFEPKSAAKRLPDGRIVSPPLEDMAPFLSREELEKNMCIPLVDED